MVYWVEVYQQSGKENALGWPSEFQEEVVVVVGIEIEVLNDVRG